MESSIPVELQEKYFKQRSKIYHSVDIEEEIVQKRAGEFWIIDGGQIKAIYDLMPSGAIIAGGAVLSLVSDGRFKNEDIDVYFKNGNRFDEMVDRLVSNGFSQNTETKFALTFYKKDHKPVQLIKTMWFKSAEHIIDTFDFVTCQFAIESGYLTYNPLALADAASGRLVLNHLHFPSSVWRRIVKYEQKGFVIDEKTKKLVKKAMKNKSEDEQIICSLY